LFADNKSSIAGKAILAGKTILAGKKALLPAKKRYYTTPSWWGR